jgi:hypothetical protein
MLRALQSLANTLEEHVICTRREPAYLPFDGILSDPAW